MSYYPSFAERLDHYLSVHDRSGAWLAQRLGVNPATVTRWRSGESRPNRPEVIIQIADLLGIQGDDRQQLLIAAGYGYLDVGSNSGGADDTGNGPLTPPHALVDDLQNLAREAAVLDQLSPAGQPASAPVNGNVGLLGRLRQLVLHPTVPIGVAVVVAIGVAIGLWRGLDQPGFRSAATVQQFAIAEWKNLSPGASAYELIIIEDTRRILYEKLSQVAMLQGVSQRSPQLPAGEQNQLAIWIEGTYRKLNTIVLAADIYGPGGTFLATVSVQGDADDRDQEAAICLLDLQNQLAVQVLIALSITVQTQEVDAMTKVPTSSCAALRLNNGAAQQVMNDNLQSAQSALEQALALDPNYADAHNNLGQVFYRQAAWARAVEQVQRALALQPRNAIYHYNLGLAYERLGDYAAAVQAYEGAIALDPLYTQAFNNLGFTHLLRNDPAKAVISLQQGLKLDPKAAYLHKNLGRAYLDQGDPARAVGELTQAVDLFTEGVYAEALYYLALAYHQAGERQHACATLLHYAPVANQDDAARADQAAAFFSDWACE